MPIENWRKMGADSTDTEGVPVVAAEQMETAPQPQSFAEKIAAARAIGQSRLDSAGATGASLFKKASTGFSNFLNKAKTWGKNVAAGAAAFPEIFAASTEMLGEKLDDAQERAWQFKENVQEKYINAPARSTAEWAARKGEQVKNLGAQGVEMASAVGRAAVDGSVDAIGNGMAAIGESYRGVKRFGSESMQFARMQMASIADDMDRRAAANRLRKLEARIGKDSAEHKRISEKLNLKRQFEFSFAGAAA